MQVHLWLGLALCVVMALWFVSGFVMMYAGYTTQIDEDLRLERMPLLAAEHGWISVEQAARAAGLGHEEVREVRLHRHLDDPVWDLRGPGGRWITVSARSGFRVAPVSPAEAVTLAYRYHPGGDIPVAEKGDRSPKTRTLDVADVWTLSGTHAPAFPVYRVDLGDDAGTSVYISRQSGDVVNVHDRAARILAFAGAVIHYLYLPQLRRNPGSTGLWKWVVVALSALGVVVCASGIWIGILYLRSPAAIKAMPHLPWSPYRGWMKWHHYTGLVFGLVSFTWVLSGMLSVNPGYTPNSGPTESPAVRLAGGPLLSSPALDPAKAIAALVTLAPSFELRELELRRMGDRSYWLAKGDARGTRLIIPPAVARQVEGGALLLSAVGDGERSGGAEPLVLERFSDSDMETALRQAVDARLLEKRWVREQETYYSSRTDPRPLPVLLGRFADARETWVYLDPATGSVASVSDRIGRWHRWGYSFLHGFDLPWLLHRRPLRDSLMILSLAGGTALSLIGIWVSILWLGKKPRSWKKRVSPSVNG